MKKVMSKIWGFIKSMFSKLVFWKKKEVEKHPDVIIPTPYMLYGLLAFTVHTIVYGICVKLLVPQPQFYAVSIAVILFFLKELYDKRVKGDQFRWNDIVSATIGILFSAFHIFTLSGNP